jgi:glycosyltransferase involved in cell wall biosynthesis
MTAGASRPAAIEAPTDLSGLRVLITHDWLVRWAGSERVTEQLLTLFPQADLVVGVQSPFGESHAAVERARETWIGKLPGARSRYEWFLPLFPLAFASVDARKYDLIISSSHAFSKAVRAPRDAVHVCYCHTPPRYLWDQYEDYRSSASRIQRVAMAAGLLPLRMLDRRAAAGVDHFIANSHFVGARIRRYYDRESAVVHPPVMPKPLPPSYFPPAERDDFFLSFGRLVSYKRVDLAIDAALEGGKRLVVAGDGPERRRLERRAAGRVEFLGPVNEQAAGRLLSECAALVFCGEEDFGIAPVEANAHGAPVVGYAGGGLSESMIDGETAILFTRQQPEDVLMAMERSERQQWEKQALVANAARFAESRFRAEITAELSNALKLRR